MSLSKVLSCFILSVATFSLSCGGGGSNSGGNTGGGGGNIKAPVLTRVNPSRFMVGVRQASIMLWGVYFTTSSKVWLDDAPANSRFVDPSDLEVYLDSSLWTVAKTHTVKVTDTGGSSNVLTFEVYGPGELPLLFQGAPTIWNPFPEGLVSEIGAFADVDNDGRSDLIMVNSVTDPAPKLLIRFGLPDGSFTDVKSAGYTLPGGIPAVVLTGDFAGHGSKDLVLVYQGSYQALLNDGSGHFAPAGNGTLPGMTQSRCAVGDFNGDGRLDFVVDTGDTPPLAVLFGAGNGTFSPPSLAGTSQEKALRVATADLNRDGVSEIVYLSFERTTLGVINHLHILMGTPHGPGVDFIPDSISVAVGPFVIGDFNGDAVPDLFVLDTAGIGQTFFGDGAGNFTMGGTAHYASDGFLVEPPFVTGDFDHDGNLDIATRLSYLGPDVIEFLWGDGHGNFTGQIIPNDGFFYLTTGDVNGDGITDILTSGGFAYMSLILGRNNRNFPAAKVIWPPASGTLSAASVKGDGKDDLLISGFGDCSEGSGPPGVIYHILPNGAPTQIGTTPPCSSIIADLDGDGLADLITTNSNKVAMVIYRGDGSGTFQTPASQISIPGPQPTDYFTVRDMDRDGYKDLVIGGAILYGRGNLQFDVVDLGGDQAFLVGDFDGDGFGDLLSRAGVMYGSASRTFTESRSTGIDFWGPYVLKPAIGEFTEDGKDDVVFESGISGILKLGVSNGRTGFVIGNELPWVVGGGAQSLSVADFDGNGLADVAVGTMYSDDVVLLTRDSAGKFSVSSFPIGVSPSQTITADFNGDGKPDLAFRNYNYAFKPPTVTVLLHR